MNSGYIKAYFQPLTRTISEKIFGTVSLRKGITEFAATEVHPEDRDRYLEFFDLNTLNERVADYIQQSV